MKNNYIIITAERDYTGLNGSTYEDIQHFNDSMNEWYELPEYEVYSLDNFIEAVNDQVIDDLTESFIFKISTNR